jgi:hypothetical protein
MDTFKRTLEIFNELTNAMQQDILQVTNQFHPLKTRLECQIQLRRATKYYKQMMKTHLELRHQGLLSLKEVREKEGNLEAAEIIRKIVRHELHNDDLAVVKALRNPKGKPQLSKHEQHINQWKTINPAFHSQQQSSLKTIDVPYLDEKGHPTDDPDQACIWKTIADPIQIEEKLLARNILHFGQSQGTLFTTNRLVELSVTKELQQKLTNY